MGFLDRFVPKQPVPYSLRGVAMQIPAGAQRIVGGAVAGNTRLQAVVCRVSGTQAGAWIVYEGGVSVDNRIVGGRVVGNGYNQQTQPADPIILNATTQPWGLFWVCVINQSSTLAGDYEANLTVQEMP